MTAKTAHSETAIGAALAAHGITANVVGLRKALALFRNNGGTFEQAFAELSAAYGEDDAKFSSAGRVLQERREQTKMGSEASVDMPQGQSISASASLPDAAKGRARDADKAGERVPDAAPTSSWLENDGAYHTTQPDSAKPAHKPGHARRGAAAIAAVQTTMAKSLFDTYRLPGDDRAIGDVTWKELQGLARKHAEAFRLLSLLDGYGQPSNPDAPVREVVKEDTLREFVEIARLQNVH